MSDQHASFVGTIPEQYDQRLGPLFFEPYARDIAARLPTLTGGRVLEVACGTGIVTARLRAALPAGVTLVATDLNPPMLDYARSARQLGAGVEWQQADAQALPFPDGQFAAVVCQFGLMFVPDKPLAFREAHRVLAPGGTLLFNVWGSFAENPIGRIANDVITEYFPDDPPKFYQTPFGLDDEPLLRRLCAEAGLRVTGADRITVQATSPSAKDAAHGAVFGSPVLLAIQEKGTVAPERIRDTLAERLTAHGGAAPFRASMCALVITAVKA